MKNPNNHRLALAAFKLAIGLVLVLIPVGGAIAQLAPRQRRATTTTTTVLVSGVFASGTGGNALVSQTYRMLGVLGEAGLPDNQTTLGSQNFQHQPGFLAAVSVATATPTPTSTPTATATKTPTATTSPAAVFLPLLMSKICNTCEVEPNNSFSQANGPILSGVSFYGFQNDHDDYFKFSTAGGAITVDLSNISGLGTQLQLFDHNETRVGFAGGPPYHIPYTGTAGLYYVRVYTDSGFNTTTPYTLRITYP